MIYIDTDKINDCNNNITKLFNEYNDILNNINYELNQISYSWSMNDEYSKKFQESLSAERAAMSNILEESKKLNEYYKKVCKKANEISKD